MIREILTLTVDQRSAQYYIQFEKDRKRFSFRPTFKNKEAPAFEIVVSEQELVTEGKVPLALETQAREKVREILGNSLFDKF